MADQQGAVMGYPIAWTNHQHNHHLHRHRAAATNSEIAYNWILSLILLLIASSCSIARVFLRVQLHPLGFQVDSITIYPFNISSSSSPQITTNWDITFSVTNPNYEHLIQCADFGASIFYKGDNIILSKTVEVRDWLTEEHNKWVLQASFDVSSSYINCSVAEAIGVDMSNNGSLCFTVKVDAYARIDPDDAMREQLKWIEVSCEEVKVKFSSINNVTMGSMFGGSRKCNVEFVDA